MEYHKDLSSWLNDTITLFLKFETSGLLLLAFDIRVGLCNCGEIIESQFFHMVKSSHEQYAHIF